ncbi:elongation of very long chain fatty acids protein AAEL008004-like [Phlebotomus papatasi]|uniref:elongation of very long chain fatty acids protein AAEL008004-like n=1 Tax=Phlebotomus papatasi TaxID=29031 RepID=UPI002483EC0A|nr:elongation of very long chain fatty acids protein AAEL008004-like [Phlebotomus papatasi]
MALVIGKMAGLYHYLNDELGDPRVVDYPMMKNPLMLLILVAVYLYFVLKWGPKFMEKRKPFNLERILIVFNVIQIVVCSYIFISGFCAVNSIEHNWLCQPVDYTRSPSALRILILTYYYFLTKILDLLDTVFFVLRKKDSQVTFLHVYHHAGMLVCAWVAVKYVGGGHNVTLGLVNTFVHIAMYSYYLLAALNSKYKNNIWWKKHITQLQLIQFFILFVHYLLLFLIDCGFPKFIGYFITPQNAFMLAMFGDFYYKAYISPLKSTSKVMITPKRKQPVNGHLDTYLDNMTATFGAEDTSEIAEDRRKNQ